MILKQQTLLFQGLFFPNLYYKKQNVPQKTHLQLYWKNATDLTYTKNLLRKLVFREFQWI